MPCPQESLWEKGLQALRVKKRRRVKPDDRDRWIAWVLWVHGLSAAEIGMFLNRSRKSALSLCQKSEYGGRAKMTLEERRYALAELRAIRCDDEGVPIDKGVLPDRIFEPRPLSGAQTRGEETIASP